MKDTGTKIDPATRRVVIKSIDQPAVVENNGIKIGNSTTEEGGVLRYNSTTGKLEWYSHIDAEWKEAGAGQGSPEYIEASDIPSVDFVPIETSNLVVHELYKEIL